MARLINAATAPVAGSEPSADGPVTSGLVAMKRAPRSTSRIAAVIASKSPVSTRLGKHTLNVIEDMSLRDGYRYEQDMTAQIARTDDAREAQRAFAEKRAPVFTGR